MLYLRPRHPLRVRRSFKKKKIVFPVTILGHIPSHKHRSADQISRNKIRRWPRGGPKTHRRTRTLARLINPDYSISSWTSAVDHSGVKNRFGLTEKFQVLKICPRKVPKFASGNLFNLAILARFCPSSFRRLRRLRFCLRTFTYCFAV